MYNYKFLSHKRRIRIRNLHIVIHKYYVKVLYFDYSNLCIMFHLLYLKHLIPSLRLINRFQFDFNSVKIFISIIEDLITFKKYFYLIHSFDYEKIIVFDYLTV